ncbi:universal stress protein [Pontibacter anaerobius]|uniref:Universal stress protein n=1 Tax=Pontibacter anaerobius TaxID=2993940 RepID=A0ABT3RER7_9BACT|nr:universal stress protein [Pontibacter anaerobius]MCX2740342.1 universal stress protein [Pontibacter anaerobius]
MKTILVPIDYSDNSQNALAYALDIARITGAEIILFHAFYPIMTPPASINATDVILALEEGKARSLEDFGLAIRAEVGVAQGQAETYNSIPMKSVARMGDSYEMIVEAIHKYNTDLVVMGMQGGGPINQTLLGSTTISVMQESPVPILSVPENIPFRHFSKVVFATNLSKIPTNADLHLLRDFLKAFDAKLKILHLYRNNLQVASFDPGAALELLAEKLKGIEMECSFDIQDEVAEGIQRFIRQQQADLLVLIPQRHNFMSRLLDRSVTGKITAHPQVPLLALPAATLSNKSDKKGEEAVAG